MRAILVLAKLLAACAAASSAEIKALGALANGVVTLT